MKRTCYVGAALVAIAMLAAGAWHQPRAGARAGRGRSECRKGRHCRPREDGRVPAIPEGLPGGSRDEQRRGARRRSEGAVRGHGQRAGAHARPPAAGHEQRSARPPLSLRRQAVHDAGAARELLRHGARAGHDRPAGRRARHQVRHRPAARGPVPLGRRAVADGGHHLGDVHRPEPGGRRQLRPLRVPAGRARLAGLDPDGRLPAAAQAGADHHDRRGPAAVHRHARPGTWRRRSTTRHSPSWRPRTWAASCWPASSRRFPT